MSACMTASKRVAATCATSSAQKTWMMAVAAAEEVKPAVRDADLVCLTGIRPWADFERASNIIATLMTNHAEQGAFHEARE